MKALVVERLAPDFAGCAVRDVPTPTPGPGEVLVRIRAASVNFPDLLMTRGEYQLKPDLPFTPGLDFAGEAAALGEGVTGLEIGAAVVGGARTGAFAQYIAVPARALKPKPARLSFAEAASYGAAYLTARVALARRANLQPGEWVLVHGAAGGVGLAAVDLAKAMGAKVIAASASDDKLAEVSRLYAPDAVVNVTGGFRDRVKEITGGRGVDVVYDPVGGEVFDESLRCLAFDGRLLVVGFASGRIPTVSANIPLIKGISVMGVRAGEYGRQFPDRGAEDQVAVWTMAEAGTVRPHVHAELPLERWREAFELLAQRRVIGKAVVIF
ncbi:NADPH:quinone oxidoreductase [Caulobacter radicis]|uniref:NADPH:quinone oxidoreductase family protein n=1 Tax=Caulobacter radicis TaxID=2172650 RepID=UPI000D583DAF|nr:NADPH:quinone oxidoreductase family protein [Caulobacter radicis]PVM84703.1 NADPH:quinone oxidoreductase [Caulobacter radicis]